MLQGDGKEHHTLLHLLLIFLDQLCNGSLPLFPLHTCLEETYSIFGAALSRYCWKQGTFCSKIQNCFIIYLAIPLLSSASAAFSNILAISHPSPAVREPWLCGHGSPDPSGRGDRSEWGYFQAAPHWHPCLTLLNTLLI